MKKIIGFVLALSLLLSSCVFNEKYERLERKLLIQQAQIDTLKTFTVNMKKQIDDIENYNQQEFDSLHSHLSEFSNIYSRISIAETEINMLENKLQEQEETFVELMDTSRTALKEETQPVKPTNPDELYDYALQLHKNGEYQKSIENFTLLIHDYPRCDLVANAYYWNGENYFSLEQYETAMFNFDKVIQNYPNSNKVVDSKLKIALCLIGMKEYSGALTQLEKIKKNHPNYSKLNIVDEKIEWLKQQ